MATAPFVISIVLPGDTDIVSQFPGVDRTLRDLINSWLLVDHNNNPGGHVKLTMDQTADPTAVSGKTLVSARTDGSMVKQVGTAPAEYIGAFPGAVMYGAGSSTPQGWLKADGSAVSRTTYATLFSNVGTTFGVGDGVNTFNLPNLQNKVVRGLGTGSYGSVGNTGGADTVTLARANIPDHTHGVTDPGHSHQIPANGTDSNAFPASGQDTGASINTRVSVTNISIAANGGASPTGGITPTPTATADPYIVLTPFIKY